MGRLPTLKGLALPSIPHTHPAARTCVFSVASGPAGEAAIVICGPISICHMQVDQSSQSACTNKGSPGLLPTSQQWEKLTFPESAPLLLRDGHPRSDLQLITAKNYITIQPCISGGVGHWISTTVSHGSDPHGCRETPIIALNGEADAQLRKRGKTQLFHS